MRKILYLISIAITALFLCSFTAGVEIGDPDDKQLSEQNTPIVKYEETIAPHKSSQELYKQYHLLAVSSLEEAQTSFQENQLWTYRMVHNASNYIMLLKGLVSDEYQQDFLTILDELKPLIEELKNKHMYKSRTAQLKNKLKNVEKTLERDYSWEKVKEWIKE